MEPQFLCFWITLFSPGFLWFKYRVLVKIILEYENYQESASVFAWLKVIGIRLRSLRLACEPSKCCSSRLLSFPFPYVVFLLKHPDICSINFCLNSSNEMVVSCLNESVFNLNNFKEYVVPVLKKAVIAGISAIFTVLTSKAIALWLGGE